VQNIESRVTVSALLRLKQLGVVALPVHDCLVVLVHHAELTKAVMEMTFKEVARVEATAVINHRTPRHPMVHLEHSPLEGGVSPR
jgi:hypothetical protein